MAVHRVEQFFGHVRASVTPAEMTACPRHMCQRRAWPLFGMAMPVRRPAPMPQDVVARLTASGFVDDPDLLVSSVCLPRRAPRAIAMRLWHRVARRAAGGRSLRPPAGAPGAPPSPTPRSWRYPVFTLYLHPPRAFPAEAAPPRLGCSARAAGFHPAVVADRCRCCRCLAALVPLADEASLSAIAPLEPSPARGSNPQVRSKLFAAAGGSSPAHSTCLLQLFESRQLRRADRACWPRWPTPTSIAPGQTHPRFLGAGSMSWPDFVGNRLPAVSCSSRDACCPAIALDQPAWWGRRSRTRTSCAGGLLE
jgi:hypothetical protein